MGENIGPWIIFGGFVLNIIVSAVSAARAIARMEISLLAAIVKERKEIDLALEAHSRQFGETVQAIRQKVTDVELYVRDNYVRRDGFFKVRDELSADIKILGEQLYARLERMEGKIDNGR